MSISFTSAQLSLINTTESVYVEACPGAGKTQAVVQRFLNRPDPDPRRGVALISFTNMAIEEVRKRSSSRPDLLRAPNFVGTVDSFINRFIVQPVFAGLRKIAPTFRDTWISVPGTLFQTPGVPMQLSLSWFKFHLDGSANLEPDLAPYQSRHGLKSLSAYQLRLAQEAAKRKWLALISIGTLDAATSRKLMSSYLTEPWVRAALVDVLRGRFAEVIVDEMQDCSDQDVELLELIIESGIRLVMVGDEHQSIYEFRGASQENRERLRRLVNVGQRLDGNFRSSPAICSLVNGLRPSNENDEAVGPNATSNHAVHVMRYQTEKSAVTRVTTLLNALNMPLENVIVLAHDTNKARICAGAPFPPASSNNKLVRLAQAIHDLQQLTTSQKSMTEAQRTLAVLLRELTSPDLLALSEREFLEHVGLSSQQFRNGCLRLALALPPPFDGPPSVFKQNFIGQRVSQGIFDWANAPLKTPNGDRWPSIPTPELDGFHYSSIHRFKGLQERIVVLVIPKVRPSSQGILDGVELWVTDQSGEPRNVLYVGASRAEELLVLWVHDSVSEDVRSALLRDGVFFEEH
jgi:DNA helicase-2/ATP-dependent DNA helicase PcrA